MRMLILQYRKSLTRLSLSNKYIMSIGLFNDAYWFLLKKSFKMKRFLSKIIIHEKIVRGTWIISWSSGQIFMEFKMVYQPFINESKPFSVHGQMSYICNILIIVLKYFHLSGRMSPRIKVYFTALYIKRKVIYLWIFLYLKKKTT